MAHRVKCFYCGHVFDRDKVDCVPMQNGRRYAHKKCYDNAEAVQEKTAADKTALEDYIKELFHYDKLPKRVENQIKEYTSKNGYTYSGILKTLKYFFEIKGHTIEKANGGIGIVPFVYEDARNYWYDIWATQQHNKEQIKCVNTQIREIHITPPQREPMKHLRRLFTFLEEE